MNFNFVFNFTAESSPPDYVFDVIQNRWEGYMCPFDGLFLSGIRQKWVGEFFNEDAWFQQHQHATSIDWSPNYHMSDGLKMTYQWWTSQPMSSEKWDFSAEDEALTALDKNRG